MQLKNLNQDHERSPQQLYPQVQRYLTAIMLRQTYNYETATQSHGPFLHFSHQKLPAASNHPYLDCTPEQLVKGSNSKFVLTLQLLRVLQYDHVLFCYTLPEQFLNNPNKFAVLVIVFKDVAVASSWNQFNQYLTILQIRNPYKGTNSLYAWTPLVITKPENIITKQRHRLINRDSELLKSEANLKFKEKKYQQALFIYEMALGLTTNPLKRRERAVLYANSSQCLFEMRLYESAQIYAEISSSLDHKYIKACFRKLNCQLQLRRFEKVPLTIHAIRRIGTDKQFEEVSAKYTRYLNNSLGLFDWKQIFLGAHCQFGQYTSPKLQTASCDDPSQPLTYLASDNIHPQEMILFHKPLVYHKLQEHNFSQDYLKINQQIVLYAQLENFFRQRFSLLPNQHSFEGQPVTVQKHPDRIQISETRSKCLRCLQLEKSVALVDVNEGQDHIGIWDSMYYFRHKCLPNCTYLHIKGGLAIFALRDIPKGEPLSLDFFTLITKSRGRLRRQKTGELCTNCAFCAWGWNLLTTTETELLYIFYQSQKEKLQGDLHKISLYFLWQLMNGRSHNEALILREYLLVLEKWPVWQCVVHCFTYLRTSCRTDLFDPVKSTLKRILEKYFRLTHAQAVELLKQLL